jgi:hypothetical protein
MGALGLCSLGNAAYAGSVTQPGETVGINLAAPLPEGVYFVNTASVGSNRGFVPSAGSNEGLTIPVIAWATPWEILGGRIQFLVAQPALYSGSAYGGAHHSSTFAAGIYNPFLAGMIAWNLGGGFSVSYLAGAYIGIDGGQFNGAFDQTTFRQDLSLAYANNGWNATANLIFGIVGNNQSGPYHTANPDYFNYDLALTKTLGKWEVGIVGFGSTDIAAPSGRIPGTLAQYYGPAQSQFALGGLVGYNFGPVIAQAYVTQDVYQSGYNSYETRGWLRLIVPLWNPETPKAVAAKY